MSFETKILVLVSRSTSLSQSQEFGLVMLLVKMLKD